VKIFSLREEKNIEELEADEVTEEFSVSPAEDS
jgi:hypothetical protein